MKKPFLLLFLPLWLLFSQVSIADAIKNLEFEWEDGKPQVYDGNPYAYGNPNGGSALIKTLIIHEAGKPDRSIDESAFILPSDGVNGYTYNTPIAKDLYISNTTGYYLCHRPESTGCSKEYENTSGVNRNKADWKSNATAAFSDKNLNHYVGGDPGKGLDFTVSGVTDATYQSKLGAYLNTPRHLLSYGNGIKVGAEGDGYIIVSERGGNNSFYILARGTDRSHPNDSNHILGDVYIKYANTRHCSNNTNSSPYVSSGRMQENSQEICVAVYPIQDLAPAGATINSIEMWAASSDPGDGKIMLVHTLANPTMCYDYSIREGKTRVPSEEREFSVIGDQDISFTVALKSEDAEVPYEHVKLKVTTTGGLNFQNALYSPNTVNKFIPAKYIVNGTPYIAFGQDAVAGDTSTSGGTIEKFQRYFAKFNYTPLQQNTSGKFNLDLNMSIDVNKLKGIPGAPNYQNVLMSTNSAKYNDQYSGYTEITRCPQSPTYNPRWGTFNIERLDSDNYDTISEPNKRFPLYTQVVGKDFDFSIVAYDGNTTPAYLNEMPLDGYTVDVELIDAGTYDDNNSFFRCADPDPEIIQTLGDGERSHLFTFENDNSRIDVDNDTSDLITDTALRNAAFRIWIIVDNNGTIIPHSCRQKNNNTCYQNVYDNDIASGDTQGYCSNCSSYSGGCYQCLRDYFSAPICSRDNFAIRPASFSLAVLDSNESTDPTKPKNFIANNTSQTNTSKLAAGYNYVLEANATSYANDSRALGYHRYYYNTSTDLISQEIFDTNTGLTCTDTTSYPWNIRFYDGKIQGNINDGNISIDKNNLQSTPNVGNYTYHLEDLSWTIVDQDNYEDKDGNKIKTFRGVDDCVGINNGIPDTSEGSELYGITNTKNERSGCGISSSLSYNGYSHFDLPLRYEPYSFDVKDINITLPNIYHFVYTNDLSDPSVLNLSMAVKLNGRIVAKTKEDIVATNYINGCAASPVDFDVNRTLSRGNDTIDDSNITAYNEADETTAHLGFQRHYILNDLSSDYNETNDSTTPLAFTIPPSEFDTNGSAPLDIYYNINKVNGTYMNPVKATFNSKEANATTLALSAHLQNNYHPTGTAPLGDEVNFLYARLASEAAAYIVPAGGNRITIPVYLDVYCDSTIMNCTMHDYGYPDFNSTQTTIFSEANSTTAKTARTGKWYVNLEHDSTTGDGEILTIKDGNGRLLNNGAPQIEADTAGNTARSRALNTQNGKSDINVTNIPSPYNDTVNFKPNSWIDPTGGGNPNLSNPAGGGWVGTGNTGNVVNTDASQSAFGRRVDW